MDVGVGSGGMVQPARATTRTIKAAVAAINLRGLVLMALFLLLVATGNGNVVAIPCVSVPDGGIVALRVQAVNLARNRVLEEAV